MPHPQPPAGQPRQWWRIENHSDGTAPVVYIYDEISWWGISASDFAREIAAIDSPELTVRINSPGGSVWDGLAILNALRAHPARVTVFVDGIAASAASFIAMAGDEVVMSRNSEMMIHDATGMAIGNAELMRRMAEDLDRNSANIASIYAERAGGTVDAWRDRMRAETWFTAQEAVDAGLADRVDTAKPDTDADKAKARFDLSVFAYAGRAKAPAPLAPVASAAGPAAAGGTNSEEEGAMPDTLIEGLRQRLGTDADADEATVLAALDEALTEQTDSPPSDTALPATTPPASPPAPATVPAGTVLVDEATLTQLRADATAGAEARAEQQREHRVRTVDNAIAEGRIPPARRDHWLAQLEADPGAEQVLASLAAGTIPLVERGSNSEQPVGDDEAIWNALYGLEKKGA